MKCIHLTVRSTEGSCDHSNKLSGSIQGGNLPDQVGDCQIKKDFAAAVYIQHKRSEACQV